MKNEVTRRVNPPDTSTDYLFPATTGCVLLRSDDKISLFDLQQRKVLAELIVPQIKFAIWSSSDANANVALIGRDGMFVARLCVIVCCVSLSLSLTLIFATVTTQSDCDCRSPFASALPRARADSHQERCVARQQRLYLHDAQPHQILPPERVCSLALALSRSLFILCFLLSCMY